jgi:hypothetical protein
MLHQGCGCDLAEVVGAFDLGRVWASRIQCHCASRAACPSDVADISDDPGYRWRVRRCSSIESSPRRARPSSPASSFLLVSAAPSTASNVRGIPVEVADRTTSSNDSSAWLSFEEGSGGLSSERHEAPARACANAPSTRSGPWANNSATASVQAMRTVRSLISSGGGIDELEGAPAAPVRLSDARIWWIATSKQVVPLSTGQRPSAPLDQTVNVGVYLGARVQLQLWHLIEHARDQRELRLSPTFAGHAPDNGLGQQISTSRSLRRALSLGHSQRPARDDHVQPRIDGGYRASNRALPPRLP